MSDNNNSSSGGVGCLGVILIVFVILKLVGTITWSWGYVLSPLWIGIAFWIIIISVATIIVSWTDIAMWFINLNDKIEKVLSKKTDKKEPKTTICWSCGEPYDTELYVSCPYCENE